MAQVNKIDSNVTGLRYAEETSLGVLPGTPEWIPLEPNSYSDFGGSVVTVARAPIADDRQRKKGILTDLDASGGINTDLTQTNLEDLLQGFFFADLRPKGEEIVTAVDEDSANPDEYQVASTTGFQIDDLIKGSNFTNAANNAVNTVTAIVSDTSVEVVTGQLVTEASPPATAQITVIGHEFQSAEVDIDDTGTYPTLTRASGVKDFTDFGINVGEWIFIGGDGASEDFVTAANNGFKRVRSVTETAIEFDKSDATMVAETGTGLTIRLFFGRVLKNETGTNIVRRSYNLERTLGAPDDASPAAIQSEYLVKSVPNEMTFTINTADKITADLSFVAGDHETRDSATGVKSGNRPDIVEADGFNTSSDFSRIKMSTITAGVEAPTALYAFVTDMTITINNNVSPNKAVGTLGAFELTAGTFEVGGNVTAYFSNVSAVAAVRANSDVTLDFAIVKNNTGVVVDIPLLTLGDGRANVEQDQPITLPLGMDAASGASVLSTMDHTLLMVFFDYLPTAADV